ncbi:MAG: PSD1 and planctomycete cytochrome C domain-containing protein, partial [Limisphaerales bacterium]
MFRCPLILILSIACAASAAERADYLKDVKPVLARRCYACHGALKQQGGLRLDTAELIRKGGKHGAAIAAGKPAASLLLAKVSAHSLDERMPPEGEPLKPEQIAALRAWVAAGASAPKDEQPESDPREHWAFKAPVKATLPKIGNRQSAIANPVDAFLEVQRRKQGITAQPPAGKSLWLRRVTLDLVGLPPTLAEMRDFEADTSPLAHERVVDRLLASPHHGERWGRHFMDIWRYSDWWGLGAELRHSQKHIWHWRDWIVESLNADKGYDRMIVEQLAGDELAPTDTATLRATGFLARNYYLFNRTTWMDDVVEHTSKAFLGLTMNCVKCHDHKYDPFTTTDYYAMRAIFEPYHARLDELPGETDLGKNGLPRAYDLHLDRPTYIHMKGDEKRPDTNRVITAAIPVALAFKRLDIQPVQLPPPAHNPALQPWVLTNHLCAAAEQITSARRAVEAAKQKLAEVGRAASPSSSAGGKPIFADTFAAANPQLWELVDGKWDYVGGALRQSLVVPKRSAARSRVDHPADFQATLKFRATGGSLYKSVGFTFDTTDERESLVYLSAHASGPKLQVAYGRASAYSYPSSGAQARAVKLGENYELTLRVRGTLLNVAVNGEHALAFELPTRTPGRFQLITYDATAEFLAFELSALPAEMQLVKSSAPAPAVKSVAPAPITTPEQARLALKAAELTLAAAELRPAMIRAVWAADQRRAGILPASGEPQVRGEKKAEGGQDARPTLEAAALAEAKFKLAQAEADMAKAELETISPATEPKKKKEPDAGKKLKAAQDALAKAQKAVVSPGTKYTSLRAAFKALEGPGEADALQLTPYPPTSTGRRLALARWISDRQNPLTARVLVNHVWARHFGQPLVANVMDFGRRATRPVHAELLDWLAVDFMEHGWSLKHLHRQLVLSEAYAMSSSQGAVFSNQYSVSRSRTKAGLPLNTDPLKTEYSSANQAKDAENHFYWRMNS